MRPAARIPARLLAAAAFAVVAVAGGGLAEALPRGNPADRLASAPIDDYRYDRAKGCRKRPQRGTVALQRWLEKNAAGVPWGIMRCSKLGPRNYSLHAEGRALDWHLDARNRAQRRAANRLIKLLLATDRRGNRHALARRMGIQEIIWNCRSWWSGSPGMGPYSQCYRENGKRRKRVNYTLAHKDHIHFGLSWRGARKRTTFWSR
jgi:hypothetical protein